MHAASDLNVRAFFFLCADICASVCRPRYRHTLEEPVANGCIGINITDNQSFVACAVITRDVAMDPEKVRSETDISHHFYILGETITNRIMFTVHHVHEGLIIYSI